jgi:hypothetical protein
MCKSFQTVLLQNNKTIRTRNCIDYILKRRISISTFLKGAKLSKHSKKSKICSKKTNLSGLTLMRFLHLENSQKLVNNPDYARQIIVEYENTMVFSSNYPCLKKGLNRTINACYETLRKVNPSVLFIVSDTEEQSSTQFRELVTI